MVALAQPQGSAVEEYWKIIIAGILGIVGGAGGLGGLWKFLTARSDQQSAKVLVYFDNLSETVKAQGTKLSNLQDELRKAEALMSRHEVTIMLLEATVEDHQRTIAAHKKTIDGQRVELDAVRAERDQLVQQMASLEERSSVEEDW